MALNFKRCPCCEARIYHLKWDKPREKTNPQRTWQTLFLSSVSAGSRDRRACEAYEALKLKDNTARERNPPSSAPVTM